MSLSPKFYPVARTICATLMVAITQHSCAVAETKPAENLNATHASASELAWTRTPFGPDVTPVSGDFANGRHITLVKFPAGMITPVHTHSADYVGVVISGVTMHWLPGEPQTQKRLPVGSHWSIPGGREHVSECLPGADCVMAIYQAEAFNFQPISGRKLDDAAIAAIYDQVNGFDIETAQLGVSQGKSDQVRKLARMVAKDHTEVRRLAAELARAQGVRLALPIERVAAEQQHKEQLATLRALSGEAFDRAYLLHEIEFHQNAINAVEEILLPALQNTELAKLYRQVLPGFQHHLQQTKQAAAALGYR